MKYGNVEFDTYFKNYPDKNGYFGKYGGAYITPPRAEDRNDRNSGGGFDFI